MILALILAQAIVPTPVPISATPTPAPLSERTVLARGLENASAEAKALGGTLGAVVLDLGNEVSAQVNGEQSFPMQQIQELPVNVVAYEAVDEGKLQAGSITESPAALLQMAGGVDAVNARLRELGYYGIVVAPNDGGFAKPLTFAQFLSDLQSGKLLSARSQKTVLGLLAKSAKGGVIDATSHADIVTVAGHRFVIVAMLQGARGDEVAQHAVIASVEQAAHDAALQFPL